MNEPNAQSSSSTSNFNEIQVDNSQNKKSNLLSADSSYSDNGKLKKKKKSVQYEDKILGNDDNYSDKQHTSDNVNDKNDSHICNTNTSNNYNNINTNTHNHYTTKTPPSKKIFTFPNWTLHRVHVIAFACFTLFYMYMFSFILFICIKSYIYSV